MNHSTEYLVLIARRFLFLIAVAGASCGGTEATASARPPIVTSPAPTAVASISVSLQSDGSFVPGDSAQAVAITKDAAGSVLSGRSVAWSSSDAGVASVAPTGVIHANSAGTATITVQCEGKASSLTFTVFDPAIPVSPQAAQGTKNLMGYLAGLRKRSSLRVVSGQMVASTLTRPEGWNLALDPIRSQTGVDVGLVGLDVEGNGFCSRASTDAFCLPLSLQGINFDQGWVNKSIDYWNQGGLVTLMWSSHNPWTGGTVNDASQTGGSALDQLITPGNPMNTVWLAKLDSLAAGLKLYQTAGVTVLWRPFHEMNGSFWWGRQNDPASFARLWRHMFDYFTKTKGLTNLLWVYSTSAGFNIPVVAQYPGDAYVDVIGLDYYPATQMFGAPSDYSMLVAKKKTVALTEYGYQGQGVVDNLNVINSIQTSMPLVAYVMFWNDFGPRTYSLGSNSNALGFMQHPWIVDRAKLAPH